MANPTTVVQDVADRLGVARTTIWNLCRRYEEVGVEVVEDAPRSGRPWTFSPSTACRRRDAGVLRSAWPRATHDPLVDAQLVAHGACPTSTGCPQGAAPRSRWREGRTSRGAGGSRRRAAPWQSYGPRSRGRDRPPRRRAPREGSPGRAAGGAAGTACMSWGCARWSSRSGGRTRLRRRGSGASACQGRPRASRRRCLLGHASVVTTNRYVEMDIEAKRAALEGTKGPSGTGAPPAAVLEDSILTWLESL